MLYSADNCGRQLFIYLRHNGGDGGCHQKQLNCDPDMEREKKREKKDFNVDLRK